MTAAEFRIRVERDVGRGLIVGAVDLFAPGGEGHPNDVGQRGGVVKVPEFNPDKVAKLGWRGEIIQAFAYLDTMRRLETYYTNVITYDHIGGFAGAVACCGGEAARHSFAGGSNPSVAATAALLAVARAFSNTVEGVDEAESNRLSKQAASKYLPHFEADQVDARRDIDIVVIVADNSDLAGIEVVFRALSRTVFSRPETSYHFIVRDGVVALVRRVAKRHRLSLSDLSADLDDAVALREHLGRTRAALIVSGGGYDAEFSELANSVGCISFVMASNLSVELDDFRVLSVWLGSVLDAESSRAVSHSNLPNRGERDSDLSDRALLIPEVSKLNSVRVDRPDEWAALGLLYELSVSTILNSENETPGSLRPATCGRFDYRTGSVLTPECRTVEYGSLQYSIGEYIRQRLGKPQAQLLALANLALARASTISSQFRLGARGLYIPDR